MTYHSSGSITEVKFLDNKMKIYLFFLQGYLAINVLISNSSDPELRGSAMGVTMTAANMGRLLAPLLCGSIYSWSLENIQGIKGNIEPLGFPLNQFCTFYFLSAICVVIAVITASLPDSMNRRKQR